MNPGDLLLLPLLLRLRHLRLDEAPRLRHPRAASGYHHLAVPRALVELALLADLNLGVRLVLALGKGFPPLTQNGPYVVLVDRHLHRVPGNPLLVLHQSDHHLGGLRRRAARDDG